MLVDLADIDASAAKFEKMADLRIRNSDTIVLGGHGAQIKVRMDALCIEYQRGHDVNKLLKLNRGTHKIKTIILFSRGGYITLDALEWCVQQSITVYLLSYKGDVLQTMTPEPTRNAKLCFLQYQAMDSESGLAIATELIRQKTLSQIATLQKHPDLPGQAKAVDALERGLQELHKVSSISGLRSLEGFLSMPYFKCFVDAPIKWERSALKSIPEHWLKVGSRNSAISSNGDARHAVSPYHAVLNFALALLRAQVLQAIKIAGLESTVGFLHSYEGDTKDSLVFDIQEPFRAVVDDMVYSFFAKTTFKKGDFYMSLSGEVQMNPELKRYIAASMRVDNVAIDKLCRWLRSTLEKVARS
jgi:CRISP-associated protein Cas1